MDESGDWGNSIYFSTDREVAAGYAVDDHPYDMEVRNRVVLKYIECTADCFKDGSYDKGDKMAVIRGDIRELLKLGAPVPTEPEVPFMKWLGTLGYAFQCYNNDSNMEIAVPFNLLQEEDWEIIKATSRKKLR